MNRQTIYCRQILMADGWMDHMLLDIGPDGLISRVSSGKPAGSDICLNGPVIAGMPNLHSHGFQRMIGGLTGARNHAGDCFWGWRDAMYRFANRITAEQLEDCMAWVYAEMLTAGYTSCAEFHYLHHQPDGKPYKQRAETSLRVLSAANTSGIALTLLPVFYRVAGFGRQSAGVEQRRFLNSLDDYLQLYTTCAKAIDRQNLHTLGVAPHSLRAVPADDLKILLESIGETAPVHIHIAEQLAEVHECQEYMGARPVEWLLDNAPVNDRWCLVHATHMNGTERRDAAHSGAVAGLCPTTEADLGDGFFETAKWLMDGGCFGIGSDSNLRISVAEELRLLEFSERLRQGRRNILQDESRTCGRFLYEHAAMSGARALGQNTGSIKAGNRADLVELDGSHPLLAGRAGDTILDSLVFAGGTDMVRSVFVAGKQLVADGHHINEATLRESFSTTMKALLD